MKNHISPNNNYGAVREFYSIENLPERVHILFMLRYLIRSPTFSNTSVSKEQP